MSTADYTSSVTGPVKMFRVRPRSKQKQFVIVDRLFRVGRTSVFYERIGPDMSLKVVFVRRAHRRPLILDVVINPSLASLFE